MITIPSGQKLIALDSSGRKSILTITTDIEIDIAAHPDNLTMDVKHASQDGSDTVPDAIRKPQQ